MVEIFSRNIRKQLQQMVKGRVNYTAHSDTIVIYISQQTDVNFKYKLENVSTLISNGLTSQMVAQTVFKLYKSYINNLYFF